MSGRNVLFEDVVLPTELPIGSPTQAAQRSDTLGLSDSNGLVYEKAELPKQPLEAGTLTGEREQERTIYFRAGEFAISPMKTARGDR